MFDVGFTEILMIGVVSLVVIGPERLPDVARQVGKWVGKAQRFVTGVKRDLAAELQTGDLKKLIGDQKEQLDELRKVVNTTRREIETGTRDVVSGAKKKLEQLEQSAQDDEAASGAASDAASDAGIEQDDEAASDAGIERIDEAAVAELDAPASATSEASPARTGSD